MIQTRTILKVSDNSGIKKVRCIKINTKKKFANIGEVIKISVKESTPNGKLKKGEVSNAIIIRTKKGILRENGSFIKFDHNSVILVDNKNSPIGTRIFGCVLKELKNKYSKIISLSSNII